MIRKWVLNILSAMLLLTGFLGGFAGEPVTAAIDASTDPFKKIETSLLDELAVNGTTDFILTFSSQADLSPAFQMDWAARGEFVYDTLKQTAAHSQAKAKGVLDGAGFEYQTFITGNELYVKAGNLDVANRLASLSEVSAIRATRVYQISPTQSEKSSIDIGWSGDLLALDLEASVGSVDALTAWGISNTKADLFWSTLGVQGAGIRVANLDTGVQYDHPALDQAFACKDNPTSPDCWLDAVDECIGDLPCDNHGHGTHVMGTMVADNDETLTYIAGMAPDAEWIACKACNRYGTCTDLGLNTCADWVLAPNGNPDNRPHIVNNSWSYTGGNSWFLPKVNAWRAAGIFPSFVAGNYGAACASIGSPGDYQESFASAAHDSIGVIGWFSGRGPSDYGHDPFTKPNISAPGVKICSSVPINGWSCDVSGTSQAAPHSAGAVALLWSCNPSLIGHIDETFQILQYTAAVTPVGACGVPPDGLGNYTYGYGYLDVLAAGTAYCGITEQGTIEGYVYDNHGNPVEGVSISAWPSASGVQSTSSVESVTDPTGYYTMDLLIGIYDISTYKENYEAQTQTGIVVTQDDVTYVPPFILDYIGTWQEYAKFPGCPDWRRYDGEYFADTGKIYFLGGRTELDKNPSTLEMFPDIYAFDPALGLCTDTGIDMPVTISNYTIVPLEIDGADVLCTFGGYDLTGHATAAVQCYDPLANTVSQPTTLPLSVASYIPGGVASVDNDAYIFGGLAFTAPYETSETWRWDPVSKLWTRLGDMIKGVSYTQSAVVDDKIYSFGGTIVNALSPNQLIAQKVAQVLNPSTGIWTQLADMPTACGEGRAFGFDSEIDYEITNQVVVAGGGVYPGDTAEVFLYDVATNTYDYTLSDLNVSRRNHAAVLMPTGEGNPLVMWVFGGRSSDDGYGEEEPPYAPPESYEVELTAPRILVNPTSFEKNVLLDTPRTVAFDIINIGGGSLNWTISEDGGDVSWLVEEPAAGTNNTAVAVTLDPTGLDLGTYTSTLLIASNDEVDPLVNFPITMTVVIQAAGVELTPDTDTNTGDPGELVEYTMILENTGNYIDTFTLNASGDWEVVLPVDSVELENGESTLLRIKVLVPADALASTSNITTITATSAFDRHVSDSSILTTSANKVYGVGLSPTTVTSKDYPNQSVVYTLTLTNTGNVEDTFTLTASGNVWQVQLPVTSLSLAPWESEEVMVYVTIPPEVDKGDTDTVTITATSTSGVFADSELTTEVIYYRMTLPFIPSY